MIDYDTTMRDNRNFKVRTYGPYSGDAATLNSESTKIAPQVARQQNISPV